MVVKKKFDILGLGAVAVDDFLYVDGYPPADTKREVLESQRQCGGLTATALVAAARLGARCVYAGVLGEDELSEFVLETLQRERIDVNNVPRSNRARPVHSRIVVDRKAGTRNIFYNLDGVTGAPSVPPKDLILSSRVLFVDNLGIPGMFRAARLARGNNVPVVADFESDSHPEFRKLLEVVDHLILSREFAEAISGKSDPGESARELFSGNREVVAVTDGVRGCWYLEKHGQVRHQPAYKVKAVDTTGCGDVFHGAYAFALARGFPIEERFRIAAAAAALKATRPGGQAGIPKHKAVKEFLRS